MPAPLHDPALRTRILAGQRSEITGHHIYSLLAQTIRDDHNRVVLSGIAAEELAHYHVWKEYTEEDVPANRIRVWYYCAMAWLLGHNLHPQAHGEHRETCAESRPGNACSNPGICGNCCKRREARTGVDRAH